MIDLQKYLVLTPMMVIATKDTDGNPYTANVYFKYDKDYNFYFRSKIHREHSQHIINDGQVARSIVNTIKFRKEDPTKKGLQFQGTAVQLKGKEFNTVSNNIYRKGARYNQLTDSCSHIFKCIPSKIKIRDEQKYGGNGKIFHF